MLNKEIYAVALPWWLFYALVAAALVACAGPLYLFVRCRAQLLLLEEEVQMLRARLTYFSRHPDEALALTGDGASHGIRHEGQQPQHDAVAARCRALEEELLQLRGENATQQDFGL